MANKSIYPTTNGWWPYVIKTPNNMYYVGYSGGEDGNKQPQKRWNPSNYKTTKLYPYIEQFGWENLEKIVLIDGLTEDEAVKWEDKLICVYTKLGCCINKKRSGNIERNIKQYQKQYRKDHKENKREYNQQYYKNFLSTPEGKIYNRVNNYNRNHPDRKLITPTEAKEMYLLTGYIPDFIKNDDLI